MNKIFSKIFIRKSNNKTMPNLVSGFTLVEAMFAVLILSFVIVGMMAVVANSLFAARYARDEITANYLAQEVVDYVRNDRDTKVFWEGDWGGFIYKYTNVNSLTNCALGCTIDVYTSKITPKANGLLYYNKNASNNSYYNHTVSNTPSKFTRKVETQKATDGNSMDVKVTISWKNGNSDKTREMKTTLMNWTK